MKKRIPLLLVLALAALAFGKSLVAPKPEARRLSVLFFGAPTENGPHHDPVTRYRSIKKHLGTEGIDFTYCENPAVAFNAETLKHYDALLMYGNWYKDEPMPDAQKKALLSYVETGGAFLPIHCASACYGGSPDFVALVGAKFSRHDGGVFAPKTVDANHPVMKGYKSFEAWDETYEHVDHNDDRHVLQTRDKEPWTWVREVGKGRVFYTASGHDHQVWDTPEFQDLIKRAVYWSVGPEKYGLLKNLSLPQLRQESVSLPGYREQKEITKAQAPLTPAESMKLAQVPPGFELSLFAADPDIVNPIFVNWDERGRAFVIETIDYPNNLQAGNLGHDRITICEDTDGDGAADKFTRFAEKLSIPTSLVFANGGVICTNGSQMLFLKDTNGDDKADVREVLFEGFNMGDTHAGVSNLRQGFDGWIYATIGYSGFQGTVGGQEHRFSQGVFRFRPDASELEYLQPTTNNTWGLGFSEEFDIVGSTANGNPSWYLTFPKSIYEAAGLEQPRTPRADDNPIFNPMSADIRQVDQFDRYTAGAGHAIYTARRFPEDYHDKVAFVCGPTGKLVGHFDLTREGAGWKAELSKNNLFASADAWSSPVCAEVGPDGAVWICDWYNLIIQHNPTPSERSAGIDARTGRGNAYETPLRDKQHGRIYCVYPKGSANDKNPGLDPEKAATLLAGLDHPNLFWRMHAQRLISDSGDARYASELKHLVRTSTFAGPHALHALKALGQLDAEFLESALTSTQPAARRAALSLATPDQVVRRYIKDGTIDASGRELAEVLIALSQAADTPEISGALLALLRDSGSPLDDATLNDAWQIAARRHAAGILALAGDAEQASEPENLLPNPSFTETANGMPVGWTRTEFFNGPDVESVQFGISPDGRSGTCLTISSEQRVDCAVTIVLPLKMNTRYRMTGWVKTENHEANRGGGAMFNVHNGQRSRGLRDTRDWQEVMFEFETGNRSETQINLLFGGYGGGTGKAYYDDLSLIALGSRVDPSDVLKGLREYAASSGEQTAAIERQNKPDPEVHQRGQAVYNLTCIACHGGDGKGVEGAFPPLDGSEWVAAEPDLMTKIVLHGLQGPITVKGTELTSVMAPLGEQLDDQQIADVITLVRQSWSNDATPVDAEFVKKIRAETNGQKTMWTAKELGR